MERPDDIVGHKTFDTGEIGPDGFPLLRHEPLTRAEGEAMWEAAQERKRERAELMPDEKAAIAMLFEAHQRLKELGWNDPQYCPKDGSKFRIIELGSTGIFDGAYRGEWPDGSWDSWDDRDMYCSSIAPAMFKLYPDDQAKKDAKWAEAAARYADSTHDWFVPEGRDFESCRMCGFIRRADRKNKPCRGRVNVGPRETELTGG